MKTDPITQARGNVMAEFRQAEGRMVRVWDVLGFTFDDTGNETLQRMVLGCLVTVRVRSYASQNKDELFRIKDGVIRPRWKIQMISHKSIDFVDAKRLWIRAPSFNVWTGEREQKFRYAFTDTKSGAG